MVNISALNLDANKLSLSQQERLAHIDFTLMFKGEAGRSNLTERFKIAASVATRDFALYHSYAPQNIFYDNKVRLHLKTSEFKPLFEYDVIRTLATISQGFGDGFLGSMPAPVVCETPYYLNNPKLNIVAAISEAIHKNSAVEIDYISPTSGNSNRIIIPHAIVDTGLRWHVRAFDQQRHTFIDFVLTRIKSATVIKKKSCDNEQFTADKQWNNILNIELIPHPRVKFPEAVEMDYGMNKGRLTINIRAALAGYMLRLWNVDCTKDHHKFGPEFHLALKNHHVLSEVDSALLAPGGKNN